jgi:hypothetical protein
LLYRFRSRIGYTLVVRGLLAGVGPFMALEERPRSAGPNFTARFYYIFGTHLFIRHRFLLNGFDSTSSHVPSHLASVSGTLTGRMFLVPIPFIPMAVTLSPPPFHRDGWV